MGVFFFLGKSIPKEGRYYLEINTPGPHGEGTYSLLMATTYEEIFDHTISRNESVQRLIVDPYLTGDAFSFVRDTGSIDLVVRMLAALREVPTQTTWVPSRVGDPQRFLPVRTACVQVRTKIGPPDGTDGEPCFETYNAELRYG